MKNSKVKNVDIDFKHMLESHQKLSKWERVNPEVVSNLLLSGIILAQHDAIVEAELKMKTLEHENISNQARIEVLENWVLKQDDQLNKVHDKLVSMDLNGVIAKESKDIEAIKKK